jgi:zinc/manganese transport system substrate-binding protein
MRRLLFAAIVFVLCFATVQAQDVPLQVLATTTIIADIAQNVGGDLVSVQALVPPDTDIHAFEPLPSDLRSVETAEILLVNGAGLEEFLGRLLDNVSIVEPIVVGKGVEILGFGEGDNETIGVLGDEGVCEEEAHEEDATEEVHEHGVCDPHYWTNPLNMVIVADNIAAIFAEADPANTDIYFAQAEAYKEALLALDAEIEVILSVIPEERRVIITNHEFLAYFAAHYGFEILATVIPSMTTLAEPSPQELSELVELIRNEDIPVIFAELSDSNRLAEVVAEEVGQDVRIVSLYSDSLSTVGSSAASYIAYMRTNAQTIALALGD